MVYSLNRLRRRPQIEDNLKNKDDLKNEDNLKNEDDIKNEDDLENWPSPPRKKVTSHLDSHTTTDVKPEMKFHLSSGWTQSSKLICLHFEVIFIFYIVFIFEVIFLIYSMSRPNLLFTPEIKMLSVVLVSQSKKSRCGIAKLLHCWGQCPEWAVRQNPYHKPGLQPNQSLEN